MQMNPNSNRNKNLESLNTMITTICSKSYTQEQSDECLNIKWLLIFICRDHNVGKILWSKTKSIGSWKVWHHWWGYGWSHGSYFSFIHSVKIQFSLKFKTFNFRTKNTEWKLSKFEKTVSERMWHFRFWHHINCLLLPCINSSKYY